MKWWALVTVLLYVLILVVIAAPVTGLAFAGEMDADYYGRLAQEVYTEGTALPSVTTVHTAESWYYAAFWSLWSWVALMALAQVGMLVVPVRLARGRTVSKRWLFWPILASMVLMLVMAWSMYLGLSEVLARTPNVGVWTQGIAVGTAAVVWGLWTVLFAFYTTRRDAQTGMARAARFLLAGSIVELLVAVPAHLVARSRDYCCAGFSTFWGIAAGVSVMLFAFGPGVFVLFVRRYATAYRHPK